MSSPKPTNPVVVTSKVSKEYSYSKQAPDADNTLKLDFTLHLDNKFHAQSI